MRIVYFLRRKAKGSAVGIQVFIDGILAKVDALNAYHGSYGLEQSEDGSAFIIPDVPEDAVEIKDGLLTIHEPERESIDTEEIVRTEVIDWR